MVFIIIVNWNGVRDTLECLGSISRLDYPHRHTVVVDNGSSDGAPTQVKAAYPDITLIENGRNLGYTGGNNTGIRFALAQGADYVWLLNNDTVVEPYSLGRLVARAEHTERLGMISPLVYDYYRRERLQFWGVLADMARQNIVDAPDPLSRPVADNPLLWGTALFVRSSMVRRIGYLDDRYFAYHEDLDFSLRAIKAGYRTMVETTAVVYHKWAVSLGADSPTRLHFLTRNWYLLWRTHLAGFQGYTYAPKYLAWALSYAISLKDEGAQLAAADACLDGAWSALRRKFGPLHETVRMPRALKALFYAHPFFWMGVLRADIPFVLRGIAARLLGRAGR